MRDHNDNNYSLNKLDMRDLNDHRTAYAEAIAIGAMFALGVIVAIALTVKLFGGVQ